MKNKLEFLRKKIDLLDSKLVENIKKRFDLVKEIALEKENKNQPIFQKKREAEIEKRNKALAKKYQIDFNFLGKLFSDIKDESKKAQNEHFAYLKSKSKISDKLVYKEKDQGITFGIRYKH